MIRARIVVEGEVQKIGYRDLVQRVARSLGIKGFVESLRDGTVQVVCEAEEEVLEEFVKGINVKEDFIDVKKVRIVETSMATGEFGYFDIKYGLVEEELGERMGTAIRYAGAMWKDIKEMRKDIRGEIVGVREDIKDMHLEIQEMHTDMNRSFQEMAKRYDAISAELIRTREELTRAVDSLSKLIEEFIRERRAGSANER